MKNLNSLIITFAAWFICINSAYSQTITKRSLVCSKSDAYQMTITNHGSDTLYITNVPVTPFNDKTAVYPIDGSINGSYYLNWGNDGLYWFVYFNPDIDPVKMPNGGGSAGPLVCSCAENAGACTIVMINGSAQCAAGTCTTCCEESEGVTLVNPGGGVLIKGEVVVLNGVTWD